MPCHGNALFVGAPGGLARGHQMHQGGHAQRSRDARGAQLLVELPILEGSKNANLWFILRDFPFFFV